MDVAKISESKNFLIIITIIIGLVVALVIFQAGVFVGYRKASFSSDLGDSYYRAFAPQRGMMGGGLSGDDVSGGHGVVGKIVSISLPSVVVEGSDNIEKPILLTDDTMIRRSKDNLSQADLKIGDFVVVIGSPDDSGQVEARLVRLLPPPPMRNASSTSATSTNNNVQK